MMLVQGNNAPNMFQTGVNHGFGQVVQHNKDATRRFTKSRDALYRANRAKAEIWWATETSKADHSTNGCKVQECYLVGGKLTKGIG